MKFFEILKFASIGLSMNCELDKSRQFAYISKTTGERIRILQARFPLNLAAGARAAGDKTIAKALLAMSGCSTPDGMAVNLHRDWQVAFEYFSRLGGRAIVKPSSGERGTLVFLCRNYGQLAYALSNISNIHTSAIIEQHIDGREFRVLVLDSAALYILERRPLTLVSDGTSTILSMIAEQGAETLYKLTSDPRLTQMAGTPALNTCLPAGTNFVPIHAANAVNGVTLNVDSSSIPDLTEMAVCAVAALGLRYGGVDLIMERQTGRIVVLEVNSAPELEGYDANGEPCLDVAVMACQNLLTACF